MKFQGLEWVRVKVRVRVRVSVSATEWRHKKGA